MIRLPKDPQKRNQLFLTMAGALVLICAVGFGLVRPQYARLAAIRSRTVNTRSHLQIVKDTAQESDKIATDLANVTYSLNDAEEDMATGDIYAWTIDTIRHFKTGYKLDIPDIGQPSISDVDLLPHFTYKQLKFTLHGTGYYHDIGRFIADFENRFPHMRILNTDMEPVGGESEKLSFRMDVVALVKSSS